MKSEAITDDVTLVDTAELMALRDLAAMVRGEKLRDIRHLRILSPQLLEVLNRIAKAQGMSPLVNPVRNNDKRWRVPKPIPKRYEDVAPAEPQPEPEAP